MFKAKSNCIKDGSPIEPIIPKELFYRVQEELAGRAVMNKAAVTRKKNQKSKFSSEYALAGLLLCGDCGQEYRRVADRGQTEEKTGRQL